MNSAAWPVRPDEVFNAVARIHGKATGCWDVLAWRKNEVRFVESKWQGKDSIRASQLAWLEAALKAGINITAFEIWEWTSTFAARRRAHV